MRYKPFGKTGLSISEVAVGTWGVGGSGWGGADRGRSISAIRTMVEQGVNLIDTAPVYGMGSAEEVVAEAIKGMREKLVIATKGGLKIDAPKGVPKIATREEMISGCEASLRRLGTDYIDIFLVHWPDENTPMEETMEAMNTLKEQGKIRHIGVSNFSIPQMEEAMKYADVEVMQPPYSMVDQSAVEVMKWACERNIANMTYGSLGAGILSGKIRSLPQFEPGDVRGGFYDFFQEPKFSKVMELLKVMDQIAEAHGGVPLSQMAINWTVQRDIVQTALVGVRTDEHARENCGASGWMLTGEELARLDGEVQRLFAQ